MSSLWRLGSREVGTRRDILISCDGSCGIQLGVFDELVEVMWNLPEFFERLH